MIFIYNINEKNPSLTISYFFGSKYWNKGYRVESLKEVINYCKSKYNFKKLIATCLKENYPSNKLLHKLGFSHIKEDKEKIYYELKL